MSYARYKYCHCRSCTCSRNRSYLSAIFNIFIHYCQLSECISRTTRKYKWLWFSWILIFCDSHTSDKNKILWNTGTSRISSTLLKLVWESQKIRIHENREVPVFHRILFLSLVFRTLFFCKFDDFIEWFSSSDQSFTISSNPYMTIL